MYQWYFWPNMLAIYNNVYLFTFVAFWPLWRSSSSSVIFWQMLQVVCQNSLTVGFGNLPGLFRSSQKLMVAYFKTLSLEHDFNNRFVSWSFSLYPINNIYNTPSPPPPAPDAIYFFRTTYPYRNLILASWSTTVKRPQFFHIYSQLSLYYVYVIVLLIYQRLSRIKIEFLAAHRSLVV